MILGVRKKKTGFWEFAKKCRYVEDLTLTHFVRTRSCVSYNSMVGEMPRIHPENFGSGIVTETLLICCPGCLFDTQGENVLNRTEAAAD